MEATTVNLGVEKIRIDGDTQGRLELDGATVDGYAERMQAGDEFPPVVVFFDGKDYWLADGFHRVEAKLKAGDDQIRCEIRQGSRRDAVLYAVGANANHGLRRNNADKRRCVALLLADAEWSQHSDRWIAEQAGVSQPFVSKLRKQPTGDSGYHLETNQAAGRQVETRVGRDGKQYKRKPKPQPGKFDDVFSELSKFDNAIRQIRATWRLVKEISNGPASRFLHVQDIQAALSNAEAVLKYGKPHCECPYCKGDGQGGCKGDGQGGCKGCKGAGWVPQSIFNQAPPPDETEAA